MFGVLSAKLVENCCMENIWAKMGHLIVKKIIRISLVLNAPTALGKNSIIVLI